MPASRDVIVPRRIIIARNVRDPVRENLRGQIWIYFDMQKLGSAEINLAPDNPNMCSSVVRLADGSLAFVKYTLQDIEGLKPSDVPFLFPAGNGMFKHKTNL